MNNRSCDIISSDLGQNRYRKEEITMSKNDEKVLAYDTQAKNVIKLVVVLAVIGIAVALFLTGTIYDFIDMRRMDDELVYGFAICLTALALLMYLLPIFTTASFQKKIDKIGEDVLLNEINNRCLYEYKITNKLRYYFTQNYIVCTDRKIWEMKDIKSIDLLSGNNGLHIGLRVTKGSVYSTTIPIKTGYQGVRDAVLQANPNIIDNIAPKLKK